MKRGPTSTIKRVEKGERSSPKSFTSARVSRKKKDKLHGFMSKKKEVLVSFSNHVKTT